MRAIVAIGIGCLLLALAPAAPAGLGFSAVGYGDGAYGHESASRSIACPLNFLTVAYEPAGPILVVRSTGTMEPAAVDPLVPEAEATCLFGLSTAFHGRNFQGNPETGFTAHRVVDHDEPAGISYEWLEIGPFTSTPVPVHYFGQTVGGPAPSQWFLDGSLLVALAP